ncbi:hypothetical protein [Arsenicibacter rosenii]|uniref:Uncharacterized protein n=1 Tax=Arsenicibacter rosenii TaxID=1750698 RepID=A0A1S2VNG0_9BACT|nr:hypothetical protein [Arsenicibacter rosenii]OIN60299.1 hypothetical protein BLX24_05565 [Arsenicibacter rosenii]
MKKIAAIGLFVLLTLHMLAYLLVYAGMQWQEEHDLSKRLGMYRSVDSLVEFQLIFSDQSEGVFIKDKTADGFNYHGQYYSVVSIEIRGDTMRLLGLPSKSRSFWQSDLLLFLNDHIKQSSSPHQKTNEWLKLLLKEYLPTLRPTLPFGLTHWYEDGQFPAQHVPMVTRILSVFSPPPEA